MSNTLTRVISGVILVILVVTCLFLGTSATLIAFGVVGLLVIDEIIVNFYLQKRTSKRYVLAISFFSFFFWFLNFYQISKSTFSFIVLAGIFLNLLMLLYLFLVYQKSEALLQVFKATSWLTGLIVLLPILCLSYIIQFNNWVVLLVGLFILNFMVDTAAYFTGIKFGKHKLWPSVSPKKTIEGALGGVVCSVIATTFYWEKFVAPVSILTMLYFAFVACSSQVGDLFQSKLKRQFEIKDSSSLIPGHGGVYDRVDSLLFVAPFYAFYLMAIYH